MTAKANTVKEDWYCQLAAPRITALPCFPCMYCDACYQNIDNHQKIIVIFIRGKDRSIENKNGFAVYKDLVSYFLQENYKIYVKLHPLYKDKYFNKDTDDFTIIRKNFKNSIHLLKEIRPQFVVSWYSSILAESLYSNIIPINLITTESIEADKKAKFENNVNTLDWILYPIQKKTINWDKDKNIIKDLIKNSNNYQKVINKLLNG